MNQFEFVSLTSPFKDKLFRLAKRLLVSAEEAEDATQEVMIKLWKMKDNLNSYRSIEALSIVMIKNHCLDQLKSKRAQNLSIEHSNYSDESKNLQHQLEVQDSLNWVGKMVDNLPDQQKMIIQLRDVEQLEFEEIAQILEMNETAVRVALSRARKILRENMIKMHSYGIK